MPILEYPPSRKGRGDIRVLSELYWPDSFMLSVESLISELPPVMIAS